MQTLAEIRQLLQEEGLSPRKRLGQHFLIDKNLLGKLLELADLSGDETVLEVGPGTGSLTESLLESAGKVVAVELDRGLCRLVRRRLGERENLVLIEGDVLAGKHAIASEVLAAMGGRGWVVSNLPYNIATPLVTQCLLDSWCLSVRGDRQRCLFGRMCFTVQREVADRLAATQGRAYGTASVIVSLLGRLQLGPVVPAEAFWPRPAVVSRMVRIDFDADAAGRLIDADALAAVLSASFGHRRKQIGWLIKHPPAPFTAAAFEEALRAAKIQPSQRPESIPPSAFCRLANCLAAGPTAATA